MNKKWVIELISDLDFEGMVVDISYGEQTIAMLNYDKGVENIEIEILPQKDSDRKLKFPLQDFFLTLEKAKNLVIQCAEEDRLRKKDD